MNYTVATTIENVTKQTVSFHANGNHFAVALWDGQSNLKDSRVFDTKADAAKMYAEIVSEIILGGCSWEDRVAKLNRTGGEKTMFKKFVQRIIESEDREDAIKRVFYGKNGIDAAYQKGKITYDEHEMLLRLIEKLESGVGE